jgi:hypothetical protein
MIGLFAGYLKLRLGDLKTAPRDHLYLYVCAARPAIGGGRRRQRPPRGAPSRFAACLHSIRVERSFR